MSGANKKRWSRESGVVLIIAIFVLMLVSVVAIALIVSSGTETALAKNYSSSATVYYAALAGLEEARGRLQPKSPDYFNNTVANFLPTAGAPLQLTSVRYIRNPAPGETVDPTDSSNPYFDSEYATEFNGNSIASVSDVQVIDSISGTNAQGIPGPVFKWVRINAFTEKSLNIDVDGNGSKDGTILLYYDPLHTDSHGALKPSLVVSGTPPGSAVQALEITSLAVLPNGSKKLLQYISAPSLLNLQFPAALSLVGNHVQFTPPAGTDSQFFSVDGRDQFSVGSCTVGSSTFVGVGYVDGGDGSVITSAIQPVYYNHYNGVGGTTPNIHNISGGSPPNLPANLLRPSELDGLTQTISQSADATITPTPGGPGTLGVAHGQDLPTTMSAANPTTIVVNGDLDLSPGSWGSWNGLGYGLLLVTGELKYDPHVTWRGIVLVIGQGKFDTTAFGPGEIDGALLIAQTHYPPGGGPNALQLIPDTGGGLPDASFGPATFSVTGGNGVFYSSCWIKASLTAVNYKKLSFREIPQ